MVDEKTLEFKRDEWRENGVPQWAIDERTAWYRALPPRPPAGPGFQKFGVEILRFNLHAS